MTYARVPLERESEGLEVCLDREDRAPEVLQPDLELLGETRPHKPETNPPVNEKRYGQEPELDLGRGSKASFSAPKGRICGLKWRTCYTTIVAISIVVVIAAVLGGVLPTQLGDRPSITLTAASNTSQQTIFLQEQSGVAVISSSDGVYVYYQDEDHKIIECMIQNNTWLSSTDGAQILTTTAEAGSPLAATEISVLGMDYVRAHHQIELSWQFCPANVTDGVLKQKIVFFMGNNGQLLATNHTRGQPWSEPFSILTDDTTQPGSQALDVIQFPQFVTEPMIRIYYGSTSGGIHRAGFGGDDDTFANNSWNGVSASNPFLGDSSDPDSGVGGTSYKQLARLYVRNLTTAALTQWSLPYDTTTSWELTGNSPSYLPVAAGSAITACNDEIASGTDYVFYQTLNGSLVGAMSFTPTSGLPNFQILDSAVTGSKLRAFFDTTGDLPAAALFYYRDDGANGSTLSWLQLSRTGEVTLRGAV